MVQYLKTRRVAREMEKEGCPDSAVIEAFKEMDAGLIDATLGSNLYKKELPSQVKVKAAVFVC